MDNSKTGLIVELAGVVVAVLGLGSVLHTSTLAVVLTVLGTGAVYVGDRLRRGN